jgi:hypothetical protein
VSAAGNAGRADRFADGIRGRLDKICPFAGRLSPRAARIARRAGFRGPSLG